MRNVRHIFFDLDRTLWDFETNSRRVIADLFYEYNLNSRCNTAFCEFIEAYENINEFLWDKLRAGEISKQQLRTSRFYNSMQHFGYDDFELGYLLEEEYVQRSPFQKSLVPGTIETLDFLHERFALHIITNGFKEIQRVKMDNCGLSKYFDQVIISEEAGFTKPEKEIFLKAMQAAQSEPHESIMIGDDLHADVMGALSAGMQAVHFDPQSTDNDVEGYWKINALTELIKMCDPAYSSSSFSTR